MIILRNEEEIKKIHRAAQMVKETLDVLENAIKPGVSTLELSKLAEATTLKLGGKTAFKGYLGFPEALCTSVNSAVVHGIPKGDEILKEGDIIGIDYGVCFEGYYGDSARTVPVGFKPTGIVEELLKTTKESLEAGINAVRVGNYIQDISKAIEAVIKPKKFGIVRDYVGHGIGSRPHEDPPIPHYDTGERGPKLRAGMVICIEPMINQGSYKVKTLDDGWTVVTQDGLLSAHFEHTIAVTEEGPRVLSA